MHKYRNLDGLRGIAAFAVVLAHYQSSFYPAMTDISPLIHSRIDRLIAGTPLYLFFAGNFSVCLFFVLSGFVLSAKFFRTGSNEVLVTSAARRYLRLMLPALASILLVWALLKLGLFHNLETAKTTGSSLLAAFWKEPLGLLAAVKEGVYGMFKPDSSPFGSNPPLWTIKYELFGSFLLFLILGLFGKLRNRWFVYIVLSLVFLKTYYLAFILGIVICDLWHRGYGDAYKRLAWPMLGMGLFLGAWIFVPTLPNVYSRVSLPGFGPETLSTFAHIIGSAFVLMAALSLPALKRLLETRPMQYLGRISFSLYLVHFIVLGTYMSFAFNIASSVLPYNLSFIVTLLPALLITFIVSSLFERYVDQPSIAAARIFGNLLTGQRQLLPLGHLKQPVAVGIGDGVSGADRLRKSVIRRIRRTA